MEIINSVLLKQLQKTAAYFQIIRRDYKNKGEISQRCRRRRIQQIFWYFR